MQRGVRSWKYRILTGRSIWLPLRHVHGAAGLADHLHLVLAAFEVAREFVGGLAGEFVGIWVGLSVDIGDVADVAGRQPRHRQHRLTGRPALLVRIAVVGDVPALDDRERLSVGPPPFGRICGWG